MNKRSIRVGIDVGGTHTKAVAIDHATHEIVGKASVMTTHDHPMGVAAGVIESFEKCLVANDISPEDVIFIAHSTTQATNALLEGDVAEVGIIGMANSYLESILAKKQTEVADIDLGTGRFIKTHNRFIRRKNFSEEAVTELIDDLAAQGAKVIVASKAFGVDDQSDELVVKKIATEKGMGISVASEISKLYGLTRRTRTAAINGSILPKMLDTANSTEMSVRKAGISSPLMIMRGDGGVMSVDEMKKRPVLTMLSGPAASVVGALMYLRASNGIYFEVGGTSTNIGVIKNGRPTIDYTVLGGHPTYVNSLDVRVLGVAGGSMVRANDKEVVDVGPRSAHIAGMPYAVYTPLEEMEDPQLEFFSPKEGDPADYVCVRLKSGKRVTITNSCAANVLGLVTPDHFSYGNVESARKAIEPLAAYMGKTVEEVATAILDKAFQKIKEVIYYFAEKYKIEKDQISLVGVGGGAASLLPYAAAHLEMNYSIPENAEVISSIGVALAMVRDVVERIITNPTAEDIRKIKKEVEAMAIENGALADTIEVQVEIEPQTSKVTAIALGSTEVQATDLLKVCDKDEAVHIAAASFRCEDIDVKTLIQTPSFFVFGCAHQRKQAIRILDKKGFIKIQRSNGGAELCPASQIMERVDQLWSDNLVYKADLCATPDFYLCIKGKLIEYENMIALEYLKVVMDAEVSLLDEEDEVIIITAKNDAM